MKIKIKKTRMPINETFTNNFADALSNMGTAINNVVDSSVVTPNDVPTTNDAQPQNTNTLPTEFNADENDNILLAQFKKRCFGEN